MCALSRTGPGLVKTTVWLWCQMVKPDFTDILDSHVSSLILTLMSVQGDSVCLWTDTRTTFWALREKCPNSGQRADTVRLPTEANDSAFWQMFFCPQLSVLLSVLSCLSFCLSSVVSVDLTDSSMAPGGRGYDRLLSGLTCRLPLTSDFLLSHQQGDSDVVIQLKALCTS